MAIITLAQVKTFLGLSDSTYDTAISAAIPYIDATVKQITRNRFNYQIIGNTTIDSDLVYVYSVLYNGNYLYQFIPGKSYPCEYDDLNEYLETGCQVSGDQLTSGSYITEVYYNGYYVTLSDTDYNVPVIKLSANATETKTGALIFTGINIAYLPIIAKAVWWHTLQINTTIKNDIWSSKTMGPLSVTKQDMDAKIDGSYGVPLWLVKALPHYHGGH